jgi:hypothetical protein
VYAYMADTTTPQERTCHLPTNELSASLVQDLTGGRICLHLAVYAYMADITTPQGCHLATNELSASLVQDLTGGRICLHLAVYAYMADITTPAASLPMSYLPLLYRT